MTVPMTATVGFAHGVRINPAVGEIVAQADGKGRHHE